MLTLAALANDNGTIPFQVGEKLTYDVFWGPIIAGHATLEVVGLEPVDGKECYHLVARARTNGMVDLLFHANYTMESWLDTTSLMTRRFALKRTEGRRRKSEESRYDYAAGQVVTTNLLSGKIKTSPLTGPAHDVLSLLYYLRTRQLKLDVATELPVSVVGTNYTVTLRPDERKSMYFHPVGDVQALRIEPQPTLSIVAANKGRAWFWVSDDDRRLPLLAASSMKIGNARLVLSDVKTPEKRTASTTP